MSWAQATTTCALTGIVAHVGSCRSAMKPSERIAAAKALPELEPAAVVAKYIMGPLQRIYNGNAGTSGGAGNAAAYAPGVAGAGADGGPQPRGSTSGMATVMMPSATTGLDSSSHAALQLFNQVLPALTQSVATEALGVDRGTVRGVNVQVAARNSQPAATGSQQRHSVDGGAPQQGGKLVREGSN
eukprot:XP_001695884.1 predicted protein [Chlamydomonas reinhardtii]